MAILTANVDFKDAFDSANREVISDLLRFRGIHGKVHGILTGLYSKTVCAVKCEGGISRFFRTNTGVKLECVFAPSLFNTCMDWVLVRAL